MNKIVIYTIWKRNKTWGYNPHVTIKVYDNNGFLAKAVGRASGYGYDKESAAIASALVNIPMLIDKLSQLDNLPYGINKRSDGLYFDVGCGMNAVYEWFKALGYKSLNVANEGSISIHLFEKEDSYGS